MAAIFFTPVCVFACLSFCLLDCLSVCRKVMDGFKSPGEGGPWPNEDFGKCYLEFHFFHRTRLYGGGGGGEGGEWHKLHKNEVKLHLNGFFF